MMYSIVSRDMVPPGGLSRHSHGVVSHPMVSIPQGYYIEVSRVQPRHQHGQIVRFGSAVYEINNLKLNISRSVRDCSSSPEAFRELSPNICMISITYCA